MVVFMFVNSFVFAQDKTQYKTFTFAHQLYAGYSPFQAISTSEKKINVLTLNYTDWGGTFDDDGFSSGFGAAIGLGMGTRHYFIPAIESTNNPYKKRSVETRTCVGLQLSPAGIWSTHNNKVLITNFDYEELLKKEGKNVFVFLDPPYYSATKSALYGKNGHLHKSFDHERFAENMKNCRHKWLITYDDSEYIRNLFSFANITTWNLTYGMGNITENSDQKGKELFISNYALKNRQIKNEQLQLFG